MTELLVAMVNPLYHYVFFDDSVVGHIGRPEEERAPQPRPTRISGNSIGENGFLFPDGNNR